MTAITRIKRVLFGVFFVGIRVIACIPLRSARHLCYRLMGMTIGSGSVIYLGCEVRRPSAIRIGERSIIGHDAILDGRSGITIGSDVNLSSEVAIWTLQHDSQARDFAAHGGAVSIGDRSWISFRAVILPGVTIGQGALVAAGSVVTKDVPDFTIVAGIPAKPIGTRPTDLSYRLDGNIPFI